MGNAKDTSKVVTDYLYGKTEARQNLSLPITIYRKSTDYFTTVATYKICDMQC